MNEYISKQALFEAFDYADADVMEDYGECCGCDWGFSRAVVNETINNIPIADVKLVVHAFWSWCTKDKYRCSNCGIKTQVDERMGKPAYKFCPNCGAVMSGEQK